MLKEKVRNAPIQPGVYMMKDVSGDTIYIGKAKNIKNRIRSYFFGKDLDPKTEAMVDKVCDIEFIVTNTEKEALILEADLVRKGRPKYNIELKDDKAYPYLTLTVSDLYPRLVVSRRNLSKGDLHFGPYANSVMSLVSVLRSMFKIRDCRPKNLPKKVCLSYHLGRCEGPCEDYVTREYYLKNIDRVKRFLSGDVGSVILELENNMKQASVAHHFESAAIYRDQLVQLRILAEKQIVVMQKNIDVDVVGFYLDGNRVVFNMLIVRAGRVISTRHYRLSADLGLVDIFSDFIKQYYLSHKELIPKYIYVPFTFSDIEFVSGWLSELRGSKVYLNVVSRGDKRKLLLMSNKNAKEAYLQGVIEDVEISKRLDDLKDAIDLPKVPSVMECFDISTIGGDYSVGSMVLFRSGRPSKSDYRRFKIKTVSGIDDYAMMREVLTRRYSRILREGTPMPDLVVVDGGRGQLNVALSVFRELGIRNQPLISLAKREEEIYLPNREEPIVLSSDSKGLLLLRSIRDESHRFAIGYHKVLRKKGFEGKK